MDIKADKAALRERLLRERRALAADEVAMRSLVVCDRIESSACYREARVIGAYLPILNETDLRPLIERAQRQGRNVVLPRLRSDETLEFAPYSPNNLVRGPRGVWQPDFAMAAVSLDDIDLVIVPGLGFDRALYRLGLGAGYYDRTFANRSGKPFLLGAGYAFQVVERLPRDPWDVPLDGLVTESAIYPSAGI